MVGSRDSHSQRSHCPWRSVPHGRASGFFNCPRSGSVSRNTPLPCFGGIQDAALAHKRGSLETLGFKRRSLGTFCCYWQKVTRRRQQKEKDHGPLKAQTESSTDFLLGNPSPHRTRDRQGCRSLVKSLSCRGTGAAGRRRQNISPAFTDPPARPPPYRPARSPPPRCRRPGAAWSPSPGYRCPHPWRRRGTGHPAGARSPP